MLGLGSVASLKMAEGESMNHPTASPLTEAASEEGDENDVPIERINSYLKDVEECMKAVEKMSSRKLNNEQCDYLKDKLRLVFQSASSYMEVSRGTRLSFADVERYRGSRSHMDSVWRVQVFELLLALAEQIQRFVRGCCEDEWIKGAMTLANVSEYVSSLGFDLELCRAACSEQGEYASLSLDKVHDKFETEFQIVMKKALVDEATLLAKVLEQHSSSDDNVELISHLRRRLLKIPHSANPSPSSTLNLQPSRKSIRAGGSSAIAWFRRHVSKALVTPHEVILGKGSFGEVKKVEWLGMTVAKKIFEGGVHEQFTKEVGILETLCNPNVISFFCSAAESSCSISMELMDSDLHSLIKQLKADDRQAEPTEGSEYSPFTHLEAVDLMLQVGQGVKYLHDQTPIIVHMDLKSPNVLIRRIQGEDSKRRYFQVKVTDFGLSETKANSICFSEQRYNLGTHRWMSPETIKSAVGGQETSSTEKEKLPKKSDVYSFAMVCYEILTGNLPFHEVDGKAAKEKAKRGDRPVLPKHCPPKLKLLIERCWSQDPQKRPAFDSICKELKYLKYLLLTDIVVFDTSTYENGLFTYGGDFLVDRPIARSVEPSYKAMMDRVRHRREPFPAKVSTTNDGSAIGEDGGFDLFGNTDSINGDLSDDSITKYDPSGLETLVELLIRSDVIVQIALFQTLLEERFALPIVVPYNEDFSDLRHLLEALTFVQVKLYRE